MKKLLAILKSPFVSFRRLGRYLVEIFRDKQIRTKILVTLFIIFIYRLLAVVPLPGVDMQAFNALLGTRSTSEAGLLFSGFTGGALETPSIVGLGIGVYITASIIIQLLSSVIPALEQLTKEGEQGKRKIDQYTRFLTLPLAFIYSIGYLYILSQPQTGAYATVNDQIVALIPGTLTAAGVSMTKVLFMALILAAGAMVVMWLAEIITEKGIGNGASIMISVGILTAMPTTLTIDVQNILDARSFELALQAAIPLIAVVVGFVLLFALIVFVTESTRKVPIQYARRQRSGIVQESHLPLKLNQTGVMPIIFASALITFPTIVLPLIAQLINTENVIKNAFWSIVQKGSPFADFANSAALTLVDWAAYLQQGTYTQSVAYDLIFFVLIFIFSLFYIFIAFKPEDVAENLQKSGAFISRPAVRPGKATEEYLIKVLLRLSSAGGVFLGLIALIPLVAGRLVTELTGQQYLIFSAVGGTSFLIVISVALDTIRQINALRTSLNYEKYS